MGQTVTQSLILCVILSSKQGYIVLYLFIQLEQIRIFLKQLFLTMCQCISHQTEGLCGDGQTLCVT